jgi:hypothetical protein
MQGAGVRLALVVASSFVLTGCGAFLGTVTQTSGASSCENMSGGACDEQVRLVSGRHPGATQVDLTCTVPMCDRRAGSGTAVVTMPDGTTVKDVFSYAGVQGAVPPPRCKGLAFDVCSSAADGQVDGIAPSKVVVAIDVTCISTACTADRGETQVTITLADGSMHEGTVGWENADQ